MPAFWQGLDTLEDERASVPMGSADYQRIQGLTSRAVMYERLPEPASDAILQLAMAFREDARAQKMDLGIGVYRDDLGRTPVMRAIKAAERELLASEQSKSYLGLTGYERFNSAMVDLVLGHCVAPERVRAVQTPGGGAAVRLVTEFIRTASPETTVWISDPTWINHRPIMDFVGVRNRPYAYLDARRQAVDFERMIGQLASAARGDVVLVHGCCHNPSGANLSAAQWAELARLANKNGLVPFVDIAYQGFGHGIEADVQGVRHVAAQVPELLLAVSCSKNFGVYRDRVGCAAVLANASAEADLAKATLASLARVNYSFPPNHGAAAVCTILESPQLKLSWMNELEEMRLRILHNRKLLAGAMRSELGCGRFDFIVDHSGMFSLIGVTAGQAAELRHQHAIFMPDDGRVNLAGLQEAHIGRFAKALCAVLRV